MKQRFGLNRVGKSEQQKLVHKLDAAVSILIRNRDLNLGCITCPSVNVPMDAGHFVRREKMATRFNPMNLAAQCRKCNRFQGGNGPEFAWALGKRYTLDTPRLLVEASRDIKQWDVNELEQLLGAAKHSYLAYVTLYNQFAPLSNRAEPKT